MLQDRALRQFLKLVQHLDAQAVTFAVAAADGMAAKAEQAPLQDENPLRQML